VGATVRQRVAERDEKVRTHAPALALAISHVGHVQNRVRGSMGGSVAHLDPTAEIPAIALLLDGEVHLEGPSGARSVPMEAFMLAPFASAALPDELLTACTYREHGPRAVWSFHEIARRHGDVALAIAAGLRSPDQARIVMAGIGDVPRRLPVLERAILAGELKASDTREAARSALRGVDIVGSVIDGGDEHRRALAETALSRVLNDLALAA
jgi:CO/xanthine dehydrogenase FAD-binding subunit